MSNLTSQTELCRAVRRRPLRLRSRVYGRERWEVPGILGNPKLAASVKTLLESECGVQRVVANALTGRVLVEYVPVELKASVEGLVYRALDFGPMSAIEFESITDSKRTALSAFGAMASAELGCLFLKFLFLGVRFPGFGTAVALAGLAAFSLSHGRANRVVSKPLVAEQIDPGTDDLCPPGTLDEREKSTL
jgi:hypothetical protein